MLSLKRLPQRGSLADTLEEEEDEDEEEEEVNEPDVSKKEDATENDEDDEDEDSEEEMRQEDLMEKVVKWRTAFQTKYTVLHELGKGRFSMVKRCQRVRDGLEVAAKFIARGRQDDEATLREYRLLQLLRHHALPRPLALYTATPKFHVMVLKLVMGVPLLDWIFAQEETTEAEFAEYIVQLCDALRYLHNHNVVHLDIKPENLLIDISKGIKGVSGEETCHGPPPVLRLIDLGSARHLVSQDPSGGERVVSETTPPVVLGSPEFTAPEVVTRSTVGAAADLWSLGVLIYVLVSGHSPFLGTSLEATCKNIVSGHVRYPVEEFTPVTQEASDLTHELLAFNPQERLDLDTVLKHAWFHMTECDSILPVQSLADFAFRRSKIIASTQEIPLVTPPPTPSTPTIPPAAPSSPASPGTPSTSFGASAAPKFRA